MRDKGLVFDEMRRQRRALGRPFLEGWIALVVELALVALLASLAAERGILARASRERLLRDRVGALAPAALDRSGGLVGGAGDGAISR